MIISSTWPPVRRARSVAPEEVECLVGRLPQTGFDWSACEELRLEGGVWQPYAGGEILPGPALRITCEVVPDPFTVPLNQTT